MKVTIALVSAALSSIAAASPDARHTPEAPPVVALQQGKFPGESQDRAVAFLGRP